jgi:hypothetical protein
MSSTSSVHHANTPPFSPSADSEGSTPLNTTASLVSLLSSQTLNRGDILEDFSKLSNTQWTLARHNLRILADIDRAFRFTEARARGSHCGLK